MITLALLKFIEANGLGSIDTDLFWQNIGIDAEGIYIVNIGQAQPRGTRRVQRYELYCRDKSKVNGLKKLEDIINLINSSYGVCDLPSDEDLGVDSYHNVTMLPLSTPTRVGEDENGRIIWSAFGEIIY